MTRDFCKKQIGRLESLPYFPRTSEGIGELIDRLLKVARDEEHAKATVTTLCDWSTCPTPHDLARVAWELDSERDQGASAGCAKCNGTGFRVIERNGISAAAPCSCAPKPKVEAAPEKPAAQKSGLTKAETIRIPGL